MGPKKVLSPEDRDERAQVVTALIEQLDVIAEERQITYDNYKVITVQLERLDDQRKDIIQKLGLLGIKLGK